MDSRNLMVWGAIITSIFSSSAFGIALVLAFWKSDSTNLQLLIGAIIANSSTVVSYWLGSSSGSQQKTNLMAQQRQSPAGSPAESGNQVRNP